jgi:hypothetical protein
VAYIATGTDGKIFSVVDGQEGKRYYDIDAGSLIFSPDSKRVAYIGKARSKMFVTVDGQEGNQYDSVVLTGFGGRLVFDSTDSLHYLAVKDDKIYVVKRNLRR